MPASTRRLAPTRPTCSRSRSTRPSIASGDTMMVAVTARTAGKLTHQRGRRPAADDHADARRARPAPPRSASRSASDWGTGAYVVATLRRPLDRRRSACRAAPSACNGSRSTRRRARSPSRCRCRARCARTDLAQCPSRSAGSTAGEEARIVVAAVDVGILNLTNYKPPAPDDYYLGQRRLDGRDPRSLRPADRRHAGHARRDPHRRRRRHAELRRHPADAAAARALFRHRARSEPTARREVPFDIPAFAGTARVMAVAWSQGQGRPAPSAT